MSDNMEKYVCLISRGSLDGAFYRAVLALHQNEFNYARSLIEKPCNLLDSNLIAMVTESYKRKKVDMTST